MFLPNAFHWSLFIGVPLALMGVALLAGGHFICTSLHAFPRSLWAGRILAAIAWIVTGWAAFVMPLSLLNPFKRYIPFVIIICIPLSWYWLDELLACRAVSGLLMLFPTPLLLAVRAHPSSARLLLVSIAYLALTAGMVFMLYPWHLRRVCHALATSTALRLGTGIVTLATGIVTMICGILVFH